MTVTPSLGMYRLHIQLLSDGRLDMEPFSCHGKAAAGGLSGESSGDIGEGRSEGLAVQSGGGYVLPGDLILPRPKLLSVTHVGLEKVLDCLGFCLGLLDQGLQLPQLLDLAGQFDCTHAVPFRPLWACRSVEGWRRWALRMFPSGHLRIPSRSYVAFLVSAFAVPLDTMNYIISS